MTTCSSSSAARLDPEPRLGCLGTWSVPVRGMDRAVGRSFSICRSLTITFARLALEAFSSRGAKRDPEAFCVGVAPPADAVLLPVSGCLPEPADLPDGRYSFRVTSIHEPQGFDLPAAAGPPREPAAGFAVVAVGGESDDPDPGFAPAERCSSSAPAIGMAESVGSTTGAGVSLSIVADDGFTTVSSNG
nr:hypothetical protein Iba_chr09bCG11420 [Ipomoea batatas]